MKDIDKLQKRNRKLRDLTERAGSTGLAITGLIGLLFLGVLVWQIAEPTFIKGEQGEITPQVNGYQNPITGSNGTSQPLTKMANHSPILSSFVLNGTMKTALILMMSKSMSSKPDKSKQTSTLIQLGLTKQKLT